MEILKIKMNLGETVSLKVRGMLGDPPDGTGNVYVLLGDDGKGRPASLTATERRNVEISVFDCVEVMDGRAFAYRFYERKRLDEIGTVV